MRFPPFELVDWFAAAEGRFDLSLSHSDCEPLSLSDLFDESDLADFAGLRLGYGTFAGLEQLRNLVAHQYTTIEMNDVLIFSGVSEAIYTFMRTMLNPGDEVVVQSPMFHTLHAIARSIGCKVCEWHPTDETTCSFDVSALLGLCSPRTKLIVFNFPHNPTGQMISESDLRRIIETARRCNAFVFSDEQFRLLELPSVATLPAACDLYEKAVSVTGISKTLGLGGLRIGWLATRCEEVIAAAKEYRFYTTEMVNTPCQIFATRALERGDDILTRHRRCLADNVERLRAFADQHRELLVFHPPKAGTLTMVEQKTSLTSTELCERLLDDQRVFLVPGGAMGMSDRLLRFGIGRKDFAEGIARLEDFLRGMTESTQ
jgi:aspartate/methionine/tyrosine aminotransferase